ncbi:MAG: sulfatase [Nitrospinae bacterium]|nr:sulfatase [Nitrospinota bacterium]
MKRDNIVLITIDSLRWDYVGYYSNIDTTITPNIDQFLEKGIIFKNAISQSPYTWGSFATIFTSHYPRMVTTPNGILLDNRLTLAEILKRGGYRTVGFHSNPFLTHVFGYDRGFDTFEDNFGGRRNSLKWGWFVHLISRLMRIYRIEPYLLAEKINKRVKGWFKKGYHYSSPFFLWIHYMDTHGPYQSKKGFIYLNKIKGEWLWHKALRYPERVSKKEREILINRYKEEIRYLDGEIGNLYHFFKKIGLLENTIFIICSDHGDGFYEHKKYSHIRNLYDELLRIPLIIREPHLKERIEIERVVGLIDLTPTILDLVRIDIRDLTFQGYSLKPLIEGRCGSNIPDYVVSDAGPDREDMLASIRTDEWKLIVDDKSGLRELYNLKKDPKESLNLANKELLLVERLETILRKTLESPPIGQKAMEPKLNREIMRQLKGLGYMD